MKSRERDKGREKRGRERRIQEKAKVRVQRDKVRELKNGRGEGE